MSYGLTDTGFRLKPLLTIIEEVEAAVRVDVGVIPQGALKKLIAVVCKPIAEAWELAEAVNAAIDPDAAVETQLETLSSLTGTTRKPASPSTADLTLTGTPTTLVPSGSRAKETLNEVEFETLDDATITAVSAWAGATAYALGDRVTNASRVYQCITAGTSAGSGGPTTTAADITDNTAHWRYLGEGTGAVDVASEAIEDGPLEALSGEINTIVTPVSGWSSVINVEDASLGREVETDEALRIRRELELTRSGDATLAAIRVAVADLEDDPDITAVTVFHNPTDATDADGVPPHAVEVMVQGGTDQAIRDALLTLVAAGIATHGTVSGTATDTEGTVHTVKFSRPTEVQIYVDVELTYDAKSWPLDGEDQVKAAIVLYGDGQDAGRDAVSSAISAKGVFTVPGVLDVPVCHIGTAPNPSSAATVVITSRQIATYDTSRITVVASAGTP